MFYCTNLAKPLKALTTHCPVSEMTYTVPSVTLNSSIPTLMTQCLSGDFIVIICQPSKVP